MLGDTLTIVLSSFSLMCFIRPRSIRMASSRTLQTAHEWPPDRTDTLQFDFFANLTVRMT